MYATVEGDREQWFWGLAWAPKVEQLNAVPLTASLAAPYTASDPFSSPTSIHRHQPVFSTGGFLREGKNLICFSLTADTPETDLLKRLPVGKSWRVSQIGIRPKQRQQHPCTVPPEGSSGASESFMRTHAHTHTQPRLNKHRNLARRSRRLFSICTVVGGKSATQFIWWKFDWFECKKSPRCKTQIKPRHTHPLAQPHTYTDTHAHTQRR